MASEVPPTASSFDEAAYAAANPDVATAVERRVFVSGEEHYRLHGRFEQRPLRLHEVETESYLAVNPDVKRAIAAGEFRDAHQHYTQVGWKENRLLAPRRLLAIAADRKLVQELPASDEMLMAVSLWFAVSPECSGIFELRLTGAGTLLRSQRVPVYHLYNGERFDWLFEPVASGDDWKLELQMHELAGPAPALLLEKRERSPLFGGKLQGAEQLDPGWFAAVVPRTVPEAPKAPSGLIYSPVARCNLNCTHCISRVTRRRIRRLQGWDFPRFLPFARSGGLPDGVASDYSGDPLFTEVTEGGVLDLMEGLGTTIGLTTNGNALTPELARRLMRPAYRFVCVSLDAARPDTYAKVRRGARPFAEVLDNIRMLLEARQRYGEPRRPHIGINFVLMHSNLDELCEAVDLTRELGADALNGVHLIAMTADMDAESLWHEPARYNAARAKAMAYAAERGVELQLPAEFQPRPSGSGHSLCTDPWRLAGVVGNGDVHACCMPESVMGNLRENTLEEIWNGPVYRALRERVNSANPPAACRYCPIRRLPHNSASYLYHRVRGRIPLFRDELADVAKEDGYATADCQEAAGSPRA